MILNSVVPEFTAEEVTHTNVLDGIELLLTVGVSTVVLLALVAEDTCVVVAVALLAPDITE